MPEGPSILILKEACEPFVGKKILSVSGNSKAGIEKLENQRLIELKTYGKNFFLCFKKFSVRIHLMLFGSYRINERKETVPRLSLKFTTAEINFYTCVVEIIEVDLNTLYDFERDVLSDNWKPKKAAASLKEMPKAMVCDVLMDQQLFAGVGNIIKNEVLYRIKVHPSSLVGALPKKQFNALIKEARIYSFDFLNWKQKFELKKHWQVYKQKTCKRCNLPIHQKPMGKTNRRTFYCSNCQVLYK